MGVHTPTRSLQRRAAIEAEIEMHLHRVTLLIGRLDRQDGDCDLEDDDPAGDPLDLNGEMPDDEGRGILPTQPLYGVDQSAGPLNTAAANTEYTAAQNGLVRSATGGWRHAA